jgi:hypothetical protein
MNKQEKIERKSRVIIVKRNNSAYKSSKLKTNILHVDSELMQDKLASCKTQASMIDVALANSMTVSQTAQALVTFNLCADIVSAMKRIKRHEKHDLSSRIVKRAIALQEHINSLRT